MMHKHTIHQFHYGWDRDNPPVIRIAPGETVEFSLLDSSGGQVNSQTAVGEISKLDFGKVNPVAGPIYVEGAEPGDAIKVMLLEFQLSGWGWTANIPGFGLLAEQFKDPALHIWKYDAQTLAPALYGPGGRVPLKPSCSTIGLAPEKAGLHSVVPPRRVGGDMGIRDLAAGTELYLPVEVAGGLFSVGDIHAAQGDGEVCGSAIESACTLSARFELIKSANLSFPRFWTPGPVSRHLDTRGYEVTTGIGPDLMTNAKTAVSQMIDLLSKRYNMTPVDAYMLCSVCADLRISEIVDVPNWVVSFYFPRNVFE